MDAEESVNPRTFADLYNRGLSIKEIAKNFKISVSALHRRIDKWFREGYLMYYYNVLLHKMNNPISICILSFNQRIYVLRKIRMLKPITIYYSPLPRPTYLFYFDGDCLEVERVFSLEHSRGMCKNILCGRIESSLLIFENYTKYNIELLIDSDEEKLRDDIDEFIVETYFKLFNPPLEGRIYKDIISEIMRRYLGISIYRNHYYRHVYNRAVKKRIIYRQIDRLKYALLTIYAPDLTSVKEMLMELYKMEIIGGVDQVNVISFDPFIAITHSWVDKDKLWVESLTHDHFNNSKYEIYLVKRILWGI